MTDIGFDIREWCKNPSNAEAIEQLAKVCLRFAATTSQGMKDGEVTGWIRALTFLQSMVRGLRTMPLTKDGTEEVGVLIHENGFLRNFEIDKVVKMISGTEEKRD